MVDGTSLASYQGYVPTFTGDLNDYNATLGYKSIKNGWNTDASITIGGNHKTIQFKILTTDHIKMLMEIFIYVLEQLFIVDQSAFKPGGTSFNTFCWKLRHLQKVLSDKFSIGFGSEFRTETFEVIEGDRSILG